MKVTRHVVTADVGGRRFRGAQVWSVSGNTLTAAVRLEANLNGMRSFPASLCPWGAIVNDPLCLELSGDDAGSYAVVAAYPTTFGNVSGGGETSVAAGLFMPGRVPDSLSGETPYTPWYAGLTGTGVDDGPGLRRRQQDVCRVRCTVHHLPPRPAVLRAQGARIARSLQTLPGPAAPGWAEWPSALARPFR